MSTRCCALVVALALSGCEAWRAPGGGAGRDDIDDVSGSEMTPLERDADRGQDQAEAGLRIREDGYVEAGGTDVGERPRPQPPDAGTVPRPDAGSVALSRDAGAFQLEQGEGRGRDQELSLTPRPRSTAPSLDPPTP